MATVETNVVAAAVAPTVAKIPELQNGDHLTRAEFERRYMAMPESTRAELIEGVVYMSSPVSHRDHGGPHFNMNGFLALYSFATPGVEGGDNSTLRLDMENEPQPDVFLRVLPEFGGQSGNDGKYVAGAPELIAEISASSVSYDLHKKLRAYQRNGVREYIVWRVWDAAIDWFVLRDGRFEKLIPDPSAYLKSEVFPGLWLDPAALLRGDLARVMAVAQEGIASPEHAAFAVKLQSAGT